MATSRFAIRSRDGVERCRTVHKSPESVLSLAITRACSSDQDGVWTVIEWDQEMYRLTKDDGHITVEILA